MTSGRPSTLAEETLSRGCQGVSKEGIAVLYKSLVLLFDTLYFQEVISFNEAMWMITKVHEDIINFQEREQID